MSTAELNEATTPEDMQQILDDLSSERKGETPEQKGDAQIASEHAGKPATPPKEHDETPAEIDSGNEPAPEGEETGDKEASSEDWLDDDLKAEATAFGIDESDLADFASREELERALRLFDKSALDAGRKALAEGEDGQSRNERGQFAKKEEPEPKDDPPARREGQYEFKTDIYDEDLEGDLKGLRDHYDSRLATMEERLHASEARFAEAEAAMEEQRFDAAVDSLDMPKLFGTTGKESQEELKRREDVLAQAKVIQAGYRSFGRDVEVHALVSRVAPMLFASDFEKQTLKNRTRKISRQSNGRQGGGATRPQDPREDPRDEADRLYRELERG